MERMKPRLRRTFQPVSERVEGRTLLSGGMAGGALGVKGFLNNPPGNALVRPNTPVIPFGSPLVSASFVDPASVIGNGRHIVVGQKSYIGPYSVLNANIGFIKIGAGSDISDNAQIIATPKTAAGQVTPSSVIIGDFTSIGFGATVNGPSAIGGFSTSAASSPPTGIGANAVIDGATVQAGAVVGALARVGPGVTVPKGMYVLPGANVTTNAEASVPALGKVVAIPANVLSDLNTTLARDMALAAGYTNLYQGTAGTGINAGIDPLAVPGVFNGNLAAVSGTSTQPGNATSAAATGVTFEPSKSGPKFPGPRQPAVEGDIDNFKARITGDTRFTQRARKVQASLGRSNAIRADQGQPIKFNGALATGQGVTINAPLGGSATTGTVTSKPVGGLTFGNNFQAADGSVILGGTAAAGYSIGDNVIVGGGAVVDRSSIGSGASIGSRSYLSQSTIAPNAVVAPGSIIINNVLVGTVQW